MKNTGRQVTVPDKIALLQVPAFFFIRRAINQPKLLGPVQCADLTDLVIGRNQPSITGEIQIYAFFLPGRQDDDVRISWKGRIAGVVYRCPLLLGPGYRFKGKGAVVRF